MPPRPSIPRLPSAPGAGIPAERCEHLVEFYEDEEKLAQSVARFLGEGLRNGDALVLIATEPHRQAFARALGMLGFDAGQACDAGRLTLLDARETLAAFMRGDEPDRELFEDAIGPVFANLAARAPGGVRAYGEMVDVLWQDGRRSAALRLEELWNEFQERHPFRLLCAYAMGNFYREPADLARVSAAHGRRAALGQSAPGTLATALPLPSAERLEHEIAQRQEIESALRESLRELRLQERQKRQSAARGETLLKITSAIADAVTSDEVFEALVDQVAEAVGASSAALWLVDEAGTRARLVRSLGYAEPAREAFAVLPLDGSQSIPAIDSIRRGEALWIPSKAVMLELYPHLAPLTTAGRSYRVSCLPLVAQGTTRGTLALTIEQPCETDPEEREFLMLVARYASQAIERLRLLEAEQKSRAENSRLYLETLEAATRAAQLYRFAHAVVAADRAEVVFDAANDAIGEALHATRSAILTYDGAGVLRFRAWRNLSDDYRAAVEGHSPWLRDARDPAPVLVPDARRDAALAAYGPLFESEGIGALAFVPLVSQERLLGKFMVYYDQPHAFAPHEIATARAIANHLASVIVRFTVIEKLEDTIRSNELFAGVLAHDLRNPLGAILTAAQVLLMQREGESTPGGVDRNPLSRILASGQRMSAMIDQLLDFTRARSGGSIDLDPREANAAELCAQVIAELELAHPEWRIELEVTGDPAGAWDGERLLQVLSNLVANAGQHGAGRDIRIDIDGRAAERVRIDVHNAGVIPADLLPQLFDPFRSTRHRRDQSRGLGLGLFIVREVVRAHGGGVRVASCEDAGTTFTIELPRRSARAPAG